MTPIDATPTSVLFDLAKRHCGVSHKELAGLLLSGRPLSDGRSPEPPGRSYLGVAVHRARAGWNALRQLLLRLRRRRTPVRGAHEVAQQARSHGQRHSRRLLCGEAGRAMDDALKACGQSPTLYRNMMERIACEGSLTADERAEVALVLLVTAACTADVRRAVAEAREFSEEDARRRSCHTALGADVSGRCARGGDSRRRRSPALVGASAHRRRHRRWRAPMGGTHGDRRGGRCARANGRGRKRSRPRCVRPPRAPLARRCGRVVGARLRFPSRHGARERSHWRGDGGGAAPRPARWLASLSRARGPGRPTPPRRLHHLPPHRGLPGVSN